MGKGIFRETDRTSKKRHNGVDPQEAKRAITQTATAAKRVGLKTVKKSK